MFSSGVQQNATSISDMRVVTKDVVMIKLDSAQLPSCQTAASIATTSPNDADDIILVGYGSTLIENDPSRTDSYGLLHKLTVPFEADSSKYGNSWCQASDARRLDVCESSQMYAGSREYLMTAEMGVRSGDSGGPMLTSAGQILGIASHLKADTTAHILIPGEFGILSWLEHFIPSPPSPPSPSPPRQTAEILADIGLFKLSPRNATCGILGYRDATYTECLLSASSSHISFHPYHPNERESGCFYHRDYVEWYGDKQPPYTCDGFHTDDRPGDGCLCSYAPFPPANPSPVNPPTSPPSSPPSDPPSHPPPRTPTQPPSPPPRQPPVNPPNSPPSHPPCRPPAHPPITPPIHPPVHPPSTPRTNRRRIRPATRPSTRQLVPKPTAEPTAQPSAESPSQPPSHPPSHPPVQQRSSPPIQPP